MVAIVEVYEANDTYTAIRLDDGRTLLYESQQQGIYDAYDGLSDGYITVEELLNNLGITENIFVFEDSSGGNFRIENSPDGYLVISRDNGEWIYTSSGSTRLEDFDEFTTSSTTGGTIDGVIDIAALDSNVGTQTIGILGKIIDSSGNTASLETGRFNQFFAVQNDGTLIKFTAPSNAYDSADGTADRILDIQALPGLTGVDELYDSEGTFENVGSTDTSTFIKRANGEVLFSSDFFRSTYDAADGATDDSIDLANASALFATDSFTFKFIDSTGRDFDLAPVSQTYYSVRTDDDKVLLLSYSQSNTYDITTSTSNTDGVSDDVIDVRAVEDYAPLQDTARYFLLESSLGTNFSIDSGSDGGGRLTNLDTGQYFLFSETDLEAYDEFTTTGTTGNAVDYTIDIDAIFANVGENNIYSFNPEIICICAGTLIETPKGNRQIETLEAGDLVNVLKKDHDTEDSDSLFTKKPIKWIGSRKVHRADMTKNEKLFPVRICAGSLGNGFPERDLLVSRQHRIVISSPISERMFGEQKILIPAIRLISMPGIFIDYSVNEVEYFHILFDDHRILLAEGSQTESLMLGPEAKRMLGEEALEEIETIFPDLNVSEIETDSALFIPKRKAQKKLIYRHKTNDVMLFSGAV